MKTNAALILTLSTLFITICASALPAFADDTQPQKHRTSKELPSMPNFPDVPIYSQSTPVLFGAFESKHSKNGSTTRSCSMDVKDSQAAVLKWYSQKLKDNNWSLENWSNESSSVTGVMLDKGHICTIQATDIDSSDPDDNTRITITYRIMKGHQ